MARNSLLSYYYSSRRPSGSFRSFFFIPTALALITSIFVLFYISTTSNIFSYPHQATLRLKSLARSSTVSPLPRQTISIPSSNASKRPLEPPKVNLGQQGGVVGIRSQRPLGPRLDLTISISSRNASERPLELPKVNLGEHGGEGGIGSQRPLGPRLDSTISLASRNVSERPLELPKVNLGEHSGEGGIGSERPLGPPLDSAISISSRNASERPLELPMDNLGEHGGEGGIGSQRPPGPRSDSAGNYVSNNEVFLNRDIFLEDYKEMKRSFKIYVYPHRRNDPFANVLLPVDSEPGGNYASESYFKQRLMKSHFITNDPTKADLFFLPFSIARLRHDPRVGVGGVQDFIRDYVFKISRKYPYWNRTGGADHFYVACHSIGRSAMDKAEEVKFNSIQVVCSSSYFQAGYIAHKDACLPQIWPREGDPPNLASSNRKKLAFFAGEINSPVRQKLLQVWRNDTEIFAHFGRLKTPYADELLGSKFCLHVKGFEVNTARIADSLYYGCVPVIIANYYDLPFADILNWKSFSIIVMTVDIPLLKQILKRISSEEYLMLQSNVLKVRKHFQWYLPPVDYDAFYMVMYELWLRRSSVRVLNL